MRSARRALALAGMLTAFGPAAESARGQVVTYGPSPYVVPGGSYGYRSRGGWTARPRVRAYRGWSGWTDSRRPFGNLGRRTARGYRQWPSGRELRMGKPWVY